MKNHPVVEVKALAFSYTSPVLQNVHFAVDPGEAVSLTGKNGSGKTTLLRVIANLETPQAGEVTVCGTPTNLPVARKHIGYLPDTPFLYDHLTPREHLDFLTALWGAPATRTSELIREMGLVDLQDRPAKMMSLGQRQRLAIAMVLLHRPELLLLDEPLNGLDADTREWLLDTIERHVADGGSCIIATHLLEGVSRVATRDFRVHDLVVEEGITEPIVQ